MALTKITGEGLGSLGTGNLTHGSDSGDTRFTLNSANQYTLVLKNAGNIAGQIGGSGSDVLRFSNAAGATIMEMNAGQITKPLQPAFSVNKVGDEQTDVPVATLTVVTFGTEVFDQNNDFSSNTFTAPVTGKYQLNCGLYLNGVDSTANYYYVQIVTSNRTYQHLFDPDFGQDALFWSLNIPVLADMDAGDTAQIKFFQDTGTAQTDINGSAGSYFSGYLVA